MSCVPHIDTGAKTDNYIYINNLDDGMFFLITHTGNAKLGQQWICWKLLLPLKGTLTTKGMGQQEPQEVQQQ